MKPIALYPSQNTLLKTAAMGVGLLFGAYQLSFWAPASSGYAPAILALIGLGVIAQTGWRFLNPSPSFEADERGFSVMGSKWNRWDDFRGVHLCTVRAGAVPVANWVVVRTGQPTLRRNVHIKLTHLCGPAPDMASEIGAYAKYARRKECLIAALSNLPMDHPTQKGAPSSRKMASRIAQGSMGSMHNLLSVPARILGRRRVH